jgi:hypothetical protein
MKSVLFWDTMQHRLVILYRHIGTMYGFHLQGQEVQEEGFLTLEDGTDRMFQNVGIALPFYAT